MRCPQQQEAKSLRQKLRLSFRWYLQLLTKGWIVVNWKWRKAKRFPHRHIKREAKFKLFVSQVERPKESAKSLEKFKGSFLLFTHFLFRSNASSFVWQKLKNRQITVLQVLDSLCVPRVGLLAWASIPCSFQCNRENANRAPILIETARNLPRHRFEEIKS